MNLNNIAVNQLLPEFKFDEAKKMLEQAVKENRDIQSLHNLAWFYITDTEEYCETLPLLAEVIVKRPKHYFPYALLGEIYLRMGKYFKAISVLEYALSMQDSEVVHANLAAAHFNMGNFEKAAEHYKKAATDGDFLKYAEMVSYLQFDDYESVLTALKKVNSDGDNFMGEVNVAELYVQINYFDEAIPLFEKGWKEIVRSIDWIEHYVYALIQLGRVEEASDIIDQMTKETADEFVANSVRALDEEWTEENLAESIMDSQHTKDKYNTLIGRLLKGYRPKLFFEPYYVSKCYLYGCKEHGNKPYDEYLDK
ncbi:tetratricopeptide repeat protein [Viridibacillus sp. YIM B01967]|uniref:Tetratricopeptide repeat protein n=1 Tax=Viridibacillus soli TaxID=2798301 RepID=A0ABS1H6T0_9BACL|nr:tetratricopeptide repeat protein [Viridibacillus soli]MBK3495124.1 tetratricopeptide repeat protein [Viridibacillus soli]